MTKQTNNKLSSGEIFADRRKNPHQGRPQEHDTTSTACRRSSDFRKSDTHPWWLKVNYVTQHLCAVDPKNPKS